MSELQWRLLWIGSSGGKFVCRVVSKGVDMKKRRNIYVLVSGIMHD